MEKEYTQQKADLGEIKRRLKKEQRSLNLRRFFKNKMAVAGAVIVLLMILVALFAPLIAPHDPLEQTPRARLTPPGADYLCGTDKLGRDVLSRIIYGARSSMIVGISVCLISMLLGMTVGLYASYYRRLDGVLMRICDGLSAIPSTLLAIALMAVLGQSITNVILALCIVYTPRMARITRSAALVVKEQTYIEALRSQGAGAARIIWRHIAPNVLNVVIVQVSYNFANSIITEAALSFLGVGIAAPVPSWGNMLSEGREVISRAWWMIVFPALATAVSVIGANVFGDGLRDILDPHSN